MVSILAPVSCTRGGVSTEKRSETLSTGDPEAKLETTNRLPSCVSLLLQPLFLQDSILHIIQCAMLEMVQCSGLCCPGALAGAVTERLECVHMQRAHIDLCCIVINSGHFAEYSWPSLLQGDESGGGQGKTCHWEWTRASWRTVNPAVGPLRFLIHLPPFAPSFRKHCKANSSIPICWSTASEATRAQCRKTHIYCMRSEKRGECFMYQRRSHEVADKKRAKVTGITWG